MSIKTNMAELAKQTISALSTVRECADSELFDVQITVTVDATGRTLMRVFTHHFSVRNEAVFSSRAKIGLFVHKLQHCRRTAVGF